MSGGYVKYRLYIDEVGNSDMTSSSNDLNHRYLNLTGIIIDLDHVKTDIHPQMEGLKQRFFNSHPDEPIIFHRRELSRRLYPFKVLDDPQIRQDFDTALLNYFAQWQYHIITVTIDKLELQTRYTVWQYHPYHYCLHVLLERYVMFLEKSKVTGDVLAEARGGKEDRKLKESFTNIYNTGTQYVDASRFQNVLTSREIKLKQKSNNIAGLQLADMLAHPCYKSLLASHENQPQPAGFTSKILSIIWSKFLRHSETGRVNGWGQKWLP